MCVDKRIIELLHIVVRRFMNSIVHYKIEHNECYFIIEGFNGVFVFHLEHLDEDFQGLKEQIDEWYTLTYLYNRNIFNISYAENN